MCGIIGYTGVLNATDILLDGLHSLEYRGYDSAGIACNTVEGIRIVKEVGKVQALDDEARGKFSAFCGIGHTRWATHGGVTQVNAHPHNYGKVTLIHNGIIENYHELEKYFAEQGKYPKSQTDSEFVAMLLDEYYTGDPYEAIKKMLGRIEGAYALCIMFSDKPEEIYCTRKGSPMVACTFEDGTLVASDMVALLRYSKDYFVVPEYTIARMTKTAITLLDFESQPVAPEMLSVTWDLSSAQKGGYKHFMDKEIHEQPDALRRTIVPRIAYEVSENGKYVLPDLSGDNIPDSVFEGVNRIVITACGTAMHAGMVARIMLEKLLRIPVQVETASEYRYMNPIIDPSTLVILISQSGETTDTMEALRLSRAKGARTISVVNVKGSSIARESDYVLYTHAGPEIAVASTKAYTSQVAALYLLTFRYALATGKLSKANCTTYMNGMLTMIEAVENTLPKKGQMQEISRQLVSKEDMFFIGRGLDYALSWEGSIKFKEITYIHSEAYAAGELKHGTLSLITEGVPVVGIATQQDVLAKTMSNIKECRTRGALVLIITKENMEIEKDAYDFRVNIPEGEDCFAPFAAAVLLQMLAYYTSYYRGLDVDQPRNLAKSVTVE